jgi:hypothetical protein
VAPVPTASFVTVPVPASASSTTASVSTSAGTASTEGSYTFDPQAPDLNVAYYSQTDLTSAVSLTRICADPSIDIVILAFVTELFSGGGYPAMNMASNCWGANAAQLAAGATGLLDCVSDGFSSQIATCQSQGKKVMLSLGGSTGDLSLANEAQAVQAAHIIWDLFLGGSNATVTPIRPYGDVVLDGIDLGEFFYSLPRTSTASSFRMLPTLLPIPALFR